MRSISTFTRVFDKQLNLKYGCNPDQLPAGIYSVNKKALPFNILNGIPGYINLMDALSAYQMVHELSDVSGGMPAAASFKHVNPAGAAIAEPLSDVEKNVYTVDNVTLTPTATAYVRARNTDPLSSFW